MTTILRAFAVMEETDGHGEIVFAKGSVQARRLGANELDTDFSYVTCNRAPWADQYAPGPVSDMAKYEAGWWIGCAYCECRVEGGRVHRHDDEVPANPVERDGRFFCSARCAKLSANEKRQRERIRLRTLESLRRSLWVFMPSAVIEQSEMWGDGHVYAARAQNGRWHAQQASIAFSFPGCKIGPAKWGFDGRGVKPSCRVCSGDVEAFNAWRAAGYPSEMPEAQPG